MTKKDISGWTRALVISASTIWPPCSVNERAWCQTQRYIDGAQILYCVLLDATSAEQRELNYQAGARLPDHHIFLSEFWRVFFSKIHTFTHSQRTNKKEREENYTNINNPTTGPTDLRSLMWHSLIIIKTHGSTLTLPGAGELCVQASGMPHAVVQSGKWKINKMSNAT